jgi:sarcosine oxidase
MARAFAGSYSSGGPQVTTGRNFDVAVIGAGSFGSWTAHHLRKSGMNVVLVDAYGPANSRASSGGESRIIRMGYGGDDVYTRWAMRDLIAWKEVFERTGQELFHSTGVLWLAHDSDVYERRCLEAFQRFGIAYEKMSRAELEQRYTQIDLGSIRWGLLERDSGALIARRAVQAVVAEAVRSGVEYRQTTVESPRGARILTSLDVRSGDRIAAGIFVFACGPWFPRLFPDLLGSRIFPTRQEVFFFGTPAGDSRFAPPAMPVWMILRDEYYGLPDLESRGFKIAFDRHGPAFDPDSGDRTASPEARQAAIAYVATRFPALKAAPLLETRVCQYENTSSGDFLIDRHPGFDNVWLVGGGSGHGFKHGPSVGEHVTALITKGEAIEPRFSLASKDTVKQRAVF